MAYNLVALFIGFQISYLIFTSANGIYILSPLEQRLCWTPVLVALWLIFTRKNGESRAEIIGKKIVDRFR